MTSTAASFGHLNRREALALTARGVAGACVASLAMSTQARAGEAGVAEALAEDVGRVLPRSHGMAMDHIALGVPDMPAALEILRERTDAEPYASDPEPGQWYWSGALALGDDGFLEILGPNPEHAGFHPLKQLIRGYDAPRLLFWYVATDDFDAFTTRAEAAGLPMERVETVDFERDGTRTAYKRGILGPGFTSQRPCVIEWQAHEARTDVDRRCRAKSLRLVHPDGDAMTAALRRAGIEQVVEAGDAWMALTISTPRGEVTFENAGESMIGFGAFLRMTGLFFDYLRS